MINLIPQKSKRNIVTEYWIRVVSVWLTLWAVALLASAAVILPAYVLITSQVSSYEASAAEASEKVANYESSSQSLVQASQQAKAIIDITLAPAFSDYVKLFEDLKGPGIRLSQIKLSRGKDGIEPVILEGSASDRQTLASFKDRLEAEKPIIESVNLPIANLASDSDNKFTITVTLAKKDNL